MSYGPGDLVVLVPMLGRPHRVAPLVDSIRATTDGCMILFCTSPGDIKVHQAIQDAQCPRIEVNFQQVGDYARKINTGLRVTTQPLIFCGADDLLFHPGWFTAATAQLTGTIGVVGTNDLGSPRVMSGQHSTHSLVTRHYAETMGTIDRPGEIFHEGYWHEYVDDEQVATAQFRGMFAFAPDAHVEHLHPNWGKAPNDGLYIQQRRRMAIGRQVFNQRKRMWT